MSHDELLEAVKDIPTTRAVVELHKPMRHWTGETVCECDRYDEYSMGYPCLTIQAIEKELG